SACIVARRLADSNRLAGGSSYFFFDECSGLPLRLVEAIFLSSFSLIELYMLFDAPLSELLGRSCSLTARAAPAAFCCAFDLAGMIASPFQDMRIKRLAAAIASLKRRYCA